MTNDDDQQRDEDSQVLVVCALDAAGYVQQMKEQLGLYPSYYALTAMLLDELPVGRMVTIKGYRTEVEGDPDGYQANLDVGLDHDLTTEEATQILTLFKPDNYSIRPGQSSFWLGYYIEGIEGTGGTRGADDPLPEQLPAFDKGTTPSSLGFPFKQPAHHSELQRMFGLTDEKLAKITNW